MGGACASELVFTAKLPIDHLFGQIVRIDKLRHEGGRAPLQRFGESEFRLTTDGSDPPQFRFSPDGKLVAGANRRELGCGRSRMGSYCTTSPASSRQAASDSATMARSFSRCISEGWRIYRFDVASGKLLGRTKLADVVEEKSATHYSISEDGLWLCSWDEARPGLRLEYRDWKAAISKGVEIWWRTVAVSKAGVLTVRATGHLVRYDVRSGEELKPIKTYERLSVLASNPEGTLIAGYSLKDKAIVFWGYE